MLKPVATGKSDPRLQQLCAGQVRVRIAGESWGQRTSRQVLVSPWSIANRQVLGWLSPGSARAREGGRRRTRSDAAARRGARARAEAFARAGAFSVGGPTPEPTE